MIDLLFRVVVISASGALAPGPLTAAVASSGLKKGWRAGLEASLGHTIVELPLVLLLGAGVATFFAKPKAHFILGIVGSLFLLFFGFSTIRESFLVGKSTETTRLKISAPILTGIALTGLNPYFIAWWIGIGTPLISEAMAKAGLFAVLLLYVFHVWLDYAWLIFIASLSSLGRAQVKIHRGLLIVLGIIVVWFGLNMLIRTFASAKG